MKKIAILTGAGMSVESGLSTFRGAGGLWDNYPVEQVATPEGYAADPSLVLAFYNKRRVELLSKEPNEGHRLIASLEKQFAVTVITQNVDDLHERAGSSNIIHLHGELMKVCSSRNPNDSRFIKTLSPDAPEISLGDLADDGSQLRPFIVWFGEAVPRMDDAIAAVRDIDALIIIGTSLNVYPAAGLINYIPARVPVFLIDPNDVQVYGSYNLTHIRQGASEGMHTIINNYLNELSE